MAVLVSSGNWTNNSSFVLNCFLNNLELAVMLHFMAYCMQITHISVHGKNKGENQA